MQTQKRRVENVLTIPNIIGNGPNFLRHAKNSIPHATNLSVSLSDHHKLRNQIHILLPSHSFDHFLSIKEAKEAQLRHNWK